MGLPSFRPACALPVLLFVAACGSLFGFGEKTRLTGVVAGTDSASVQIEVYERCSPRLLVLKRCPGELLAQTQIGKPGRFVVEVAPGSRELWVVAFRGFAPNEVVCGAQTVNTDRLEKPIELTLSDGPCPLARPVPSSEVSTAAPPDSRGVVGGYDGAGFPRRR